MLHCDTLVFGPPVCDVLRWAFFAALAVNDDPLDGPPCRGFVPFGTVHFCRLGGNETALWVPADLSWWPLFTCRRFYLIGNHCHVLDIAYSEH